MTDPGASQDKSLQLQAFQHDQLQLSALGFGAAPLGNEYGVVDEAEMERTVHAAIDAGITFFDTSPYYGRTLSETRLGKLISGRRDEIVLSTKAGRYDLELPDGFDFSPSRIRSSVDESLTRLGTDWLDILLLHDIEFSDPDTILHDAIPVLQEMKQLGKARFVGVSSYRLDVLETVITETDIDVCLTYCHSDLIDTHAIEFLAPIAKANGVSLIAASPLHMGFLTPGGGPAWHMAGAGARESAKILRQAATEFGVSITHAALSFALSLPGIVATLTGMSSMSELEQNLAAWEDPIPTSILEEMRARVVDIKVDAWQSGIWPSGREL